MEDVPPVEPPAPTREQVIQDGIAALDTANPDNWMQSGAPNLAALKESSGLSDVTATERDEAWAAFMAVTFSLPKFRAAFDEFACQV